MRFLLIALCLGLGLPPQADAAPLRVVASFSILGDLVKQVGGKEIALVTLVGPDADAHAYEPAPSDVRSIASAELVVINGLGFETWFARLAEAAGYKGTVVVAASKITPLRHEGLTDPHAWQDVKNVESYIAVIRDALAKADPAHAEEYNSNAATYLTQLDALDRWTHAQMDALPASQRRAITAHDALHYFAQAYGVSFIAPLGLTTTGEVSAGTMARLIDQIRVSHIRAVFLENMTDPRLMQELVSDAGAVIGGTLYTDALSTPDAPTYIEMFTHNVRALKQALIQNPF